MADDIPAPGAPYEPPPGGSLGLLAYGYRGLEAWREVRGTDWLQQFPPSEPPSHAPTPDVAGPLAPEAEIVLVSGLPRSGTSMVMQMVEAAGVPPFTDGTREADPSNPNGYYEHEKVKAVGRDASWVPDADGHAVKVVAPLLRAMPTGPQYKVVFIERDTSEVLRSQAALLARSGRPPAPEASLRSAYARYVQSARAWADSQAGALYLNHADVISDPLLAAETLCGFLARGDARTVAATIDPSLHRQRAPHA